ncbi:MAG: fimbrillin family protein [Bacteroidales bacterium]|nr:fimbrillin family protein [Bacteroidales bacterium]
MKKAFIIILVAAVALVSCTKREIEGSKAISFQTASYATRAGIEGTVFPTTESFGIYAWAEGTIGEWFMNNEQIVYGEDGKWASANTYFWPKTTTVDFFGYYPYGMSGLAVAPQTITYSNIDVEAMQADVMYSDKAAGYGDNPDGRGMGIDGTSGVPIIFHHALAKVEIAARTDFDTRSEEDGTEHEWQVTVNKVTVSDFYKAGGATFTLRNEPTEGQVGWEKPADEAGNAVWTNDGAKTSISANPAALLNHEEPVTILPDFFVLPQAVTEPERDEEGRIIPGQNIHKVTVNVTIKTRRNGADFISETYDRSAYLWLETVPAWSINHITRYLLIIRPIGGGGGTPGSEPVPITFDPAVAAWDVLTVPTYITIE